jgi:hypothetical protein
VKFGIAHGGFIKIRREGTLQIGIYKDDKADGKWLVLKPDLTKFYLRYDNGNLI